jgi:hypothetical protein
MGTIMSKLYRRNSIKLTDYKLAYQLWYDALPVSAQAAVYHYTDSGYRRLNHALRHGKPLSDADITLAAQLDQALATSVGNEPQTLYRAVRKLNFVPIVGENVRFDYFVSTTSDPQQIFKFVNEKNPIIFEINTKLGQKISDIHTEFEFLLPRGTSFEVEEILESVDWHAEYEDCDFSRSLPNATVIRLRELT